MLFGMFFRKVLLTILLAGFPAAAQNVRLYVFDNGVLQGLDPAAFHFKKEEVAVADMVCASYLIVHPKGTLLWDSGVIADSDIEAGRGEQKRGSTTIKATK